MRKTVALLAVLALVLAACVPGVKKPEPPQARVEGFDLISVDPFSGEARFALRLRLTNPNAFELPLLESQLALTFDRARLPFDLPAVTLPPAGFEVVETRLTVPLAESAEGVGKLLGGEAVRLRVDGRVRVQAGPVPLDLGPFTLLDENVRVDLRFALPRFTIDPAQSRLRIRDATLEVVVGFQVTNPNPIGFYLRGPLGLVIGGNTVAEAVLDVPLRPRQSGSGVLAFRVDLARVPGAAAALVTGLPVELSGAVRAEVPGVWQTLLDVAFAGRVR
ncbi:LEA type 2 family protein [Oceanithermus profundus]|uniref:LEA type 2 family protein n=1 Tax=Oceanithermus profundus TaxID=187137 RepID=UPI0011D25B35|nr:LEA type 2 family protein [Oceanithermus profundus]